MVFGRVFVCPFMLGLTLLLLSSEVLVAKANVRNGDVFLEIKARLDKNTTVRESFFTNVQDNSVIMHFQLHNGMICYLAYDFSNEIKIFKVDVLGEPELGQKQYQSLCFVTKLHKNDIIASDSMAKLRQKSSGSIQEANDVLKPQEFLTDIQLIKMGNTQNILGEKFQRLCSGPESIVHAKESELYSLAKGNSETFAILKSRIRKPESGESLAECSFKTKTSSKYLPCKCKIPFTIPWYPCLVKYCPSKNSQGNSVTTRCGIKSCRITHNLGYIANHPLYCHWGVT
uniref:out at first protein homolog isoform X1 n=2 Tax=Styela clava TaxID=7725 RepID=UPI00193A4AF6|nr:out at first protein homolog isoform X1 [Styela clava]